MAPSRKNSREEMMSHLPEEILHQLILPRLPCKPLFRFRAVSKEYKTLISPDTYFSTHQSLTPSPTSTGFVYLEESGLSFFPQGDTVIGVPDPSLNFMVKSPKTLKLLCSSNGLLLFYIFGGIGSLCVGNPATMKKEIVPKEEEAQEEESTNKEMGLAFDPRGSHDRYAVVDPMFKTGINGGIEYSFNVFRSHTGGWVCSRKRVHVSSSRNAPTRPVYARGLLYWFCMQYLLWFDPEKDRAGTIPLPYENSEDARQEVEVSYKDEIACMCVTSGGGIEVWVLTGGTHWERWYELSMDKLIQGSPDHNLCFDLPSDMRKFVAPLAFDGRNVYVAVSMKEWRQEKEFLTSDHVAIGLDDQDVWLSLMNIGLDMNMVIGAVDDHDFENDDWEEDLLSCDMVTGKVVNTGKSLIRTNRNFRVFYYHNSMVALPPISK